MLVKFKETYDSNHDTFRIKFLLIPVAGLACFVNYEFSVLEVGLLKESKCKYLLHFVLQSCLNSIASLLLFKLFVLFLTST